MKKRILAFGVAATHDLIVRIGSLNEGVSVSDFDAFVIDPLRLQSGAVTAENFARRQCEVEDLVTKKGGLVIYLLRHAVGLGIVVAGRHADAYGLFEAAAPEIVSAIRTAVRAGSGSHVELVLGAKGISAGYFRVLRGALSFASYLDLPATNLEGHGGTVFAVDSVGHPIGVEFVVGAGRICFVPIPEGAEGDRVGAAIVRAVEAHYGGPSEIEAPAWLVEVSVPGAKMHDATISQLEQSKGQIEEEIEHLRQQRAALLNYRVLLYGYGKSVLEPVVRSAMRLLGFEVPEPEQYKGEWDVELRDPHSSTTAIGEVEGSEGVVDVDKYRQLLDYVQAEVLEGRDHKGILIGNGYRLAALDAAERQQPFSEHARRGAKKNGFCLLPTAELFKAVCAVLESPADEGRKIRIRDSIFSATDVWTFARELVEQKQLEPKL